MKKNSFIDALTSLFRRKPAEQVNHVIAPAATTPDNPVVEHTPAVQAEVETVSVETAVPASVNIAPTLHSAKPEKPGHKIKTYRVTGMQYYMDSLMELAGANEDYSLSKRDLVEYGMVGRRVWEYDFFPGDIELVPEPDNPADPKAIKVIASGKHIGYIKSGSCTHLLKVIRESRIINIDCEICGGKYKFISEDFDYDKDCEVYTLERSNAPHSVVLTITEK